MSRASTWTNADGLDVGFGKHTVDNEVAAVHSTMGPLKTMTMLVNLVDLEIAGSITSASFDARAARIPRGSHIVKATTRTTVAATSGGAATLGIGTYDADYKTAITADDIDGIDAAIALTAIDALGESVLCNGALIDSLTVKAGATSNSDVVIVMEYATTAFTAGQVELIVEFYPPAVSGRTIDV